jgi:hypothetical protein
VGYGLNCFCLTLRQTRGCGYVSVGTIDNAKEGIAAGGMSADRSHREFGGQNADPDEGADLEQLKADRAVGRGGELGMRAGDAPQYTSSVRKPLPQCSGSPRSAPPRWLACLTNTENGCLAKSDGHGQRL